MAEPVLDSRTIAASITDETDYGEAGAFEHLPLGVSTSCD